MSSNPTAAELEAEGHRLLAEGHAKLAEAVALRASTALVTKPTSWIPPGSVYPKRHELALARAGAVESSKVGRRVLIRRRSLEAYVASHRRDVVGSETEDLFGAGVSK
jgi:hypothetical protein